MTLLDMSRPPHDDPPVRWPGASVYADAIQHPALVLGDERLKQATPKSGYFPGTAWSTSGQQAIVFRLAVPGEAEPLALRCFTRDPGAAAERYACLASYLEAMPEAPLVSTRWHDPGIRADGRWWPVVTMPFLPGVQLQTALKDRLDEPDRLRLLAKRWRELCRRLRAARIAHGDLQHGNVLVDADDRFALVDYDEVWTPRTAHLPPGETGHRNYQHPQRLVEETWGEHIDTFPALVILTSLLALAELPDLWSFNNGDNLIFERGDFERPGGTAVWAGLDRLPSGEAATCVRVLRHRCRERLDTRSLEDLVSRHLPSAGPPSASPENSASQKATTWWNHASLPSRPAHAVAWADPIPTPAPGTPLWQRRPAAGPTPGPTGHAPTGAASEANTPIEGHMVAGLHPLQADDGSVDIVGGPNPSPRPLALPVERAAPATRPQSRPRRLVGAVLVVLFLLLFVIGMLVGMMITRQEPPPPSTSSTTAAPTTSAP